MIGNKFKGLGRGLSALMGDIPQDNVQIKSPSEKIPIHFIYANPSPGTTTTAGSGVTLEIASGNVQVPSLVGLNEINAKTILTQSGFLIREISASDTSKPAGEILAQAPEAGAVERLKPHLDVLHLCKLASKLQVPGRDHAATICSGCEQLLQLVPLLVVRDANPGLVDHLVLGQARDR